MSEERFLKIENKLSTHDRDIHSIAQSLDGINSHMERANQLLQESILKDERMNSRMEKMETHLSSQIKANNEAIKRAHVRTDKIDGIINRLAWTVISLVLVALVGLVVKVGI
jgi:predicted  nucleic acid-binding Zn-ribbon protein